MQKTSIRFFNDTPVRAVWDEAQNKWFFSVTDVLSAIRGISDYEKNRNYWKYLKTKLKHENSQVVSVTNRLKLTAPDGKRRLSDVLDADGVLLLAAAFPARIGAGFISWFTGAEDSIDEKSKQKAYALFDSTLLNEEDVGTVKGLVKIHAFLFGGLYAFAGQLRTLNIAKDGFQFANVLYLRDTLRTVEQMPEDSFDDIVQKYIEMNVAHPFMEGNGRSMRIWLDLMLKKNLQRCVDWSRVDKRDYLNAMKSSVFDGTQIKTLLLAALTDRIHDREIFMKGIDYSYYYEAEN